MVKRVLKAVARAVLGDYALYFIYSCRQPLAGSELGVAVQEPDEQQIASCADTCLQAQAGYAGLESRAFACQESGQLAALCFYWYGERYRQRGFWPLAEGEAKLVQIVVAPAARGRGLARALISASAQRMFEAGWHTLYARVWHSNVPSWRAFERAGWRRVAIVAEVNPLRRERPWRMRWWL